MELMFVPDQFLSPRNLAAVDKSVRMGQTHWGKFSGSAAGNALITAKKIFS